MRVVLIAAISADGKIAQSPLQSSLAWTSKEDTAFFVEKTKEAGVVIMGRRTFETIGRPLKGRRLIVLSETPGAVEGVEYVNASPRDVIERLEREGVTQVVVGGGSSVYSQFLHAGLVTDVYLTVEPILFGGGVHLAEGFDPIQLSLVEVTKLNAQTVLLHYQVAPS
ncbi:dihydrofolate reductase [Candidatus Uhrbacteria bacterium]|nr:dihydrofolate reductase [Candidatus Uhrbacteria bacterium]